MPRMFDFYSILIVRGWCIRSCRRMRSLWYIPTSRDICTAQFLFDFRYIHTHIIYVRTTLYITSLHFANYRARFFRWLVWKFCDFINLLVYFCILVWSESPHILTIMRVVQILGLVVQSATVVRGLTGYCNPQINPDTVDSATRCKSLNLSPIRLYSVRKFCGKIID